MGRFPLGQNLPLSFLTPLPATRRRQVHLESQPVILAVTLFGLPLAKTTDATMRKQEELVVITKAYDLILWSCNHTSRFHRQHRFVLGERWERRSVAERFVGV